jgi:hypothetical protein
MATASVGTQDARIRAGDILSDRALEAHSEDEFKNVEIARRVADLVALGKPPFNVALFGPWGSGKSSMARLVEAELATRSSGQGDSPSPAFVIYDAWKFGGKSLRRNFISHVAGKLGFVEELGYHDFYRGLYQSRRSFEFKRSALISSAVLSLALLLVLLVLFTIVSVLALALASLGTGESAPGQIESTLPQLLKAAGPVALAAAAVAFVVQGARAELEQSAPSEAEEFARRFQQLIAEVRKGPRKRHGWKRYWHSSNWWRPRRLLTVRRLGRRLPQWQQHDRLVIFVDELDRCDELEIVNTLIALRTFLDEEGVVFVVAGDRDALEKALGKAPQPKPINGNSPYYSTASAFLDKIFQHQIALPPLRGRRLSAYARSLIGRQIEQAGSVSNVWSELKVYDERAYDDVLFALVPGHVRSPRRVKVLLNNFATEARIAQSRGIAWPERAPEIAKLVVLRTEFPNFAADLFEAPQLPSLFIEQSDTLDDKPVRIQELVTKHHQLAPDELLPAQESEDNGKSPSNALKELNAAYREMLRRYLQGTDHISNPGRDLLFLEPPGEVYGLDAEISERIERDAPDVPKELVADLLGEEPAVQESAVRLLADMVDQHGGLERRRTMDALMDLVGHMPDISSVAVPAERALRRFRNMDDFLPEHLAAALRVALEVDPDRTRKRELVERIYKDGRLWEDPASVESVAMMAQRLDDAQVEVLKQGIADSLDENQEVLLAPLRDLPEQVTSVLIDDERIWVAIENVDRDGFLDDLVDTSISRLAFETAFLVEERLLDLQTPEAYALVAANADAVLDRQESSDRVNNHVLRAWQRAPTEDWHLWARRLRPGKPSQHVTERAVAAAEMMFRAFANCGDPLGVNGAQLPDLVNELSGFIAEAPEDHAVSVLTPAIQAALEGRQGESEEGHEVERLIAEAALEIGSVGRNLIEAVERVLIAHLQPSSPPQAEADRLKRMRDFGRGMSTQSIVALTDDLPELDWADRDTAAAILLTRLDFAVVLRERDYEGWRMAPFAASVDEVRQAAKAVLYKSGTEDASRAISKWIDLGPHVDALAEVLVAVFYIYRPPAIDQALGRWAATASPSDRTELALALIGDKQRARWMAVLTAHELDQTKVVGRAGQRIRALGNAPDRAGVAVTLSGLRLTDPKAQSGLIKLMDWLVGPKRAAQDAQTALLLVPALGMAPQHADALTSIARKAYKRRGKLTEDEGRALRLAGAEVDPDWFGRGVRKRVKKWLLGEREE